MTIKPRPEASPHYRGQVETVLPPKAENPGKGRKRRMTGPGFFFDPTPLQADQAVLTTEVKPQAFSESDKEAWPIKKLRFKKGTQLYSVELDESEEIYIPGKTAPASDLAREKLDFDTFLEVDRYEGMELGKKGVPVVKKVGLAQHSAFTVINLKKRNEHNQVITVKRLVNLNDRALPKNNERRRFNELNR